MKNQIRCKVTWVLQDEIRISRSIANVGIYINGIFVSTSVLELLERYKLKTNDFGKLIDFLVDGSD